MAEEDTLELEDHTVLDETEFEDEVLEGGTLLSYSGRETAVRKLTEYDNLIRHALNANQELLSKISEDSDRTIGVEILFRRLVIPDYASDTTPVLIVTEKANRTNVHITNLEAAAGGSLFIGLHSGIRSPSATVATSDVIEIVAGSSRDLNTKRALWAVGESGSTITLDIVEEFA